MNVVLLDTTFASLLHPKKKADALRARHEPHMRGRTLPLSFQTVAELWGGRKHVVGANERARDSTHTSAASF